MEVECLILRNVNLSQNGKRMEGWIDSRNESWNVKRTWPLLLAAFVLGCMLGW